MKGGRTGDPGEGIIIHFRFPQQLSICRIHGVNIGSPITDERRVARPGTCFDAAYADGRAHGGGRLKKPVDAARSGAERIDVAALAADKDTASGDGGLRVSSHITGKTESPFEFQTGHFGSGEARHRAILKARVRRVHAPAVPERSSQRVGEVTRCGAAHGLS